MSFSTLHHSDNVDQSASAANIMSRTSWHNGRRSHSGNFACLPNTLRHHRSREHQEQILHRTVGTRAAPDGKARTISGLQHEHRQTLIAATATSAYETAGRMVAEPWSIDSLERSAYMQELTHATELRGDSVYTSYSTVLFACKVMHWALLGNSLGADLLNWGRKATLDSNASARLTPCFDNQSASSSVRSCERTFTSACRSTGSGAHSIAELIVCQVVFRTSSGKPSRPAETSRHGTRHSVR